MKPSKRSGARAAPFIVIGVLFALYAALAGWSALSVACGIMVAGLGMSLHVESMLLPPDPRPSRMAAHLRAADAKPGPGEAHYHGDALCCCDQPKRCCDMGAVVYPLLCPWHPPKIDPGPREAQAPDYRRAMAWAYTAPVNDRRKTP